MTRAQALFTRWWRTVLLACSLAIIAGAVVIVWARIDAATSRADGLAAEAGRRGTAVSTLAGDVRVLRAQIKASGGTPAAPAPDRAVANLPERIEVPIQVPGLRGEKGDKGDPGQPAPTIAPEPGQDATGAPGQNGQDGRPGRDGKDGADGQNGQPPAGWTYTDPQGVEYDCRPVDDFDPDAPRYECQPKQDQEPAPGPTTSADPPGVIAERRRP